MPIRPRKTKSIAALRAFVARQNANKAKPQFPSPEPRTTSPITGPSRLPVILSDEESDGVPVVGVGNDNNNESRVNSPEVRLTESSLFCID